VKPLSQATTVDSLSETQGVAGTVPYMAPEQLRGEKVDARSDIYAAGAVLYEMATGQRPFPETHGARLTDAILHQAPPSPGRLKPQLSPRLEDIILKCLEKEPESRYQSAKELLVDLRRPATAALKSIAPSPQAPAWRRLGRPALWVVGIAVVALVSLLAVLIGLNVGGLRDRLTGGAASGLITSLAVLPLDNLMGDAEQEYFVEGMHEALITELSKIGALKVISRTSAMRYKDTDKSVPEIARELGVDAVVEGSVLRAGNTVRVTAQLIHGATDEHLWAKAYERDLTNILVLQREVAQAIAREINIAVTPEEQARLASARPVNPEAHEAYLKGRYQWNKRTEEGFSQAIQFFQQAIEKDPAYARAYAGLADVYALQPGWGFAPPSEAYPRARATAQKALELDENMAEPYATLGAIKSEYDRDWSAAEQNYIRALELNPNYATAHQWYGELLSRLGKHEEAIAELESAERLDPVSPIISSVLGRVLYHARRYDPAAQQLRKTVEMHPEFYFAFLDLGRAYAQMGMHPEALAAVEKGSGLPEVDPEYGYVGWIYARTGRKAEAQRLLRRLRELSSQQ
ncbi:MAG: tetratricopeptide repeat protein, partial [Terriglobia bacterium]